MRLLLLQCVLLYAACFSPMVSLPMAPVGRCRLAICRHGPQAVVAMSELETPAKCVAEHYPLKKYFNSDREHILNTRVNPRGYEWNKDDEVDELWTDFHDRFEGVVGPCEELELDKVVGSSR